MSGMPAGVSRAQQRLREQAELHLRLAAMDDLRRDHPGATSAPHRPSGGAFWRYVFVPVYRRLPWATKERADFLAFAAKRGATLEDIAWMENIYSPPIGALFEPMAIAAQNGLAQLA